jgi:hypothetical protein
MVATPKKRDRAAKAIASAEVLLRLVETRPQASPLRERLHELRDTLDALTVACTQKGVRRAILAADKLRQLQPGDATITSLHQLLIDAQLWMLVASGFASWSGGTPELHEDGVQLAPGAPLSDWIIESRR